METYLKLSEEEKVKFLFSKLNVNVRGAMLASDFKDHKTKIKWVEPVYIQRKYDGMRCHIVVENGNVKLMSRAGKEITTMQHIVDTIKKVVTSTSKYILDGELWTPGNFQENMRLIKKVRPGETEKVHFHMYDIVLDKPYIDRYNAIKLVHAKINSPLIELVETIQIGSEADLIMHHKQFLSEGFEGTMCRIGDSGYESNKRSTSLLKYKDFLDIVLPLIEVVENDANPLMGTPVFELNGEKFKTGCKFSHEQRIDLLTNKSKYIGRICEIRYFELSETLIPRFGVMHGFRLDK